MASNWLVCFDLDGVIANSRDGIEFCINLALVEHGADPLPPGAVDKYIGPPLVQGFREMLTDAGLDRSHASDCVATYRRHYAEEALARTTAYPGIRDGTSALADVCQLAVVTSKLELFAKPILASLGVDQFFDGLFCPPPDSDDEAKAVTLARAIARMDATPGRVVMVGDRLHDVVAALENGALPVGVLWGFGTRDELETAGARLIVETPTGLITAIRQLVAQDGG